VTGTSGIEQFEGSSTALPVKHESVALRPPSRRTHPSTVVAAVLSAALITLTLILIVNHGALPLTQTGPGGNPVLVYIDGIHRNVTYLGNPTGYFGPSLNDSCPYCPVGAQAGGAVRIPLGTWYPPQNLSLWIFTNVSGPFLVQAPGCSPAPCTFAWLKVWSYETFVPAGTLLSLTLFSTFLLPNQAGTAPNFIDLNLTVCPTTTCTNTPT
jgi:hypothetical protein